MGTMTPRAVSGSENGTDMSRPLVWLGATAGFIAFENAAMRRFNEFYKFI